MTNIAAASGHLRRATGTAALLDAAYGAFEELLSALWERIDPGEAAFVPLLMAATFAANGRDAVLFAASLPPRRLPTPPAPGLAPGENGGEGAGDDLAGLSLLLAARLAEAADGALDRGDRAACHDAAGYARQIHDLLTTSSP